MSLINGEGFIWLIKYLVGYIISKKQAALQSVRI
jgi:hypothetical protein